MLAQVRIATIQLGMERANANRVQGSESTNILMRQLQPFNGRRAVSSTGAGMIMRSLCADNDYVARPSCVWLEVKSEFKFVPKGGRPPFRSIYMAKSLGEIHLQWVWRGLY